MPISKVNTNSLDAGLVPLGSGQTWQDVTASRAVGTTYTNTTGRPIAVFVTRFTGTQFVFFYFTINGVQTTVFRAMTTSNSYFGNEFIVPIGATYSVEGGSLTSWSELR